MEDLIFDYEVKESDGFISHYPMNKYEKQCFDLGASDMLKYLEEHKEYDEHSGCWVIPYRVLVTKELELNNK